MILLEIIVTTVFIIIALNVIYLGIFSTIGRVFKPQSRGQASSLLRTAVFIPAYREDAVIVESAKRALQQQFDGGEFDVFVISDSLREETLAQLAQLSIKLVTVSFEKSTKAKALKAALQTIPEGVYDTAIVLDADNVANPDFLARINDFRAAGSKVVQGQRIAKNLDNGLALLDALSEGINNHIFRRGHASLGFSAALIGSGMAFDFELFRNLIYSAEAIGGFDKELELKLLAGGVRIDYAPEAIVLDEKVSHSNVFVGQRTRWLSAQLHYARLYGGQATRAIMSGNFDFADKIFQTLLIPRAILLGLVPLFGLIVLFTGTMDIAPWIILAGSLAFSLIIAIPPNLWNRDLMKAVLALPRGLFLMIRALLKSPGGNSTFIHTTHQAR